MGVAQLLEPVLTGGIRDTNFFNGRIVTADDMRTMQVATRLQNAQLGRAIGEGVAFGLEARLSSTPSSVSGQPILRIGSGLAFNRRGEAVELPTDVELALVRAAQIDISQEGVFVQCPPPRLQTTLTNFGLYVLTVQPASRLEGRAPMTEFATEGIGTACASRYAVAGVTFRLAKLELGANTDSSTLRGALVQLAGELDAQVGLLATSPTDLLQAEVTQRVSRLRNGVAQLCFGTTTSATFAADPTARFDDGTSTFTKYGLLDEMRDQGVLTDCEVCLALVYWTSAGVQFVDRWAVRRQPVVVARPQAWPLFTSDRLTAERLSTILQFQDHLDDLVASDPQSGHGISANAYFEWLPPMGILTVAGTPAKVGVDPLQFFESRTVRGPVYIEGADLYDIFRTATLYPPIDLGKREAIWLYLIRENIQGIQSASVRGQVLVFSNGQMPLYGNPRFDLNYWNYANYA
jgi:hypothetical protein